MTRLRGIYGINASGQNVAQVPDVLLMDGNISIGQLTIPLNDTYVLTNATLTENAAGGDVSINVAAGQNAVIGICGSEYIKQVNAFITTLTVPAIGNDGKLADGTGDTPVLKGTKLTSFQLAYSVQGGALTSFNFRADLNVQSNAVANAITSLVANGQNGLSNAATASATTCSVINIPVIANAQAFDVNISSSLYLRLNPVTPGGVTLRIYSIAMNFAFNYN